MVLARTLGGGDIAFLTGHAPFVGALDIHTVEVHAEDGSRRGHRRARRVHRGEQRPRHRPVRRRRGVEPDRRRAGPRRPGARRGGAARRRRRGGRGRPPAGRRAPRGGHAAPAAARPPTDALQLDVGIVASLRAMAIAQRLGVVLLVPQPLATEIDGVRRALGDERARAHRARTSRSCRRSTSPSATCRAPSRVVRTAASTIAPLTLRIGPVATFAPVNPVAYLQVGGEPQVLEALERLRVVVPPGSARAPVRRTSSSPTSPSPTS